MYGLFCWFVAIAGTGVLFYLIYFIAIKGGEMALRREREEHLRIVNEARRKAGNPPITERELTLETEHARPQFDDGRARGFVVGAPVEVADDDDDDATIVPAQVAINSPPPPPSPPRPPVQPKQAKALVSIVLLEAEYRDLIEPELRALVERAWGVAIPVNNPSTTEFVTLRPGPSPTAGSGPGIVCVGGYRFLVHNQGRCYFDDVLASVDGITDPATQQAVTECRAWRGVDLLEGNEEEVMETAQAYALVGKLAATLAGATTLGFYFPELRHFFPYNGATLKALMSENVIGALRAN